MHNNNNGGNKNRNHKRFSKNNNFKKRRFGVGGGSSSHIEEEFINPQARRNFAMKRDQHLMKAKECLAAGERIDAENHFQHAEHYHRMSNIGLDKIQQQQQQQQPQGEFEQGMEADNSYSDSAPNYDEQAIDEAPEIPVDSMGSFPTVNKPAHKPSVVPVVENNLSSLPFMQPLKETE